MATTTVTRADLDNLQHLIYISKHAGARAARFAVTPQPQYAWACDLTLEARNEAKRAAHAGRELIDALSALGVEFVP